jgi:hypothetical protein
MPGGGGGSVGGGSVGGGGSTVRAGGGELVCADGAFVFGVAVVVSDGDAGGE